MTEKKQMAEFIATKRKENGMTQQELADKLYVGKSTISKWERGISYPDISMVAGICRELHITEHEFFIACEDVEARREHREARTFGKLKRGTAWVLMMLYAIAIVTCFIVNLAVEHKLSWFFIVLPSVALSFSITNLPWILKRFRVLIPTALASILAIGVEAVCNAYTGGDWLKGAVVISLVSLAGLWIIIFAIANKMNVFFKIALSALTAAILVCIINPIVDYYFPTELTRDIMDYVNPMTWNTEILGDKIACYVFAGTAVVTGIMGVIRTITKRK